MVARQGHHEVNQKSPAGLVQYRRLALSFLAIVGPPDAHATRRRSPCSGSHPPTRTGPVAVDRKIQFIPVGPARQSDRQIADAPCNRRFVPRPDPGFACEAGASSGLPVPFKGGRSATRRVVSVGMLVHPRKRTKHGRRVPWPSGPREHRFRARR